LKVRGIALFPFILAQNHEDLKDYKFINHERIHLRQQLELLIIPFFVWYILEYLILRMTMNHKNAYRNIVFEREAYTAESDLKYLTKRRPWQFMKYYKNSK